MSPTLHQSAPPGQAADHNQRRLSLNDVLEGHYLACILDGMHQEGVLAEFVQPARSDDVAARRGWSAGILDGLIAFVAERSTAVDRLKDGSYVIAEWVDLRDLTHALDQYVGAFGPGLQNIGHVLRGENSSSTMFDETRHAAAFAQTDYLGDAEVRSIVLQLGIDDVLDIGCGGGGLLIGLARGRPNLIGIGIDANPVAVALARRRIAGEGLQGRLEVDSGSAVEALRALPQSRRDAIQVVTACSVVNAYFGDGGTASIVGFLKDLGALLPGRILVVADYYGRLGSKQDETKDVRRTLIQDVVQIVSGQGIPPFDVTAWRAIYAQAGCPLIDVLEGFAAGVVRFIHIVQLPPGAAAAA